MKLNSIEDTKIFSKNFSKIIKKNGIIFLYGEIGVGKTTFVRFFINYLESLNGLGISDVPSPTFNILYNYDIGSVKVLHYDLYRLKNKQDVLQLDMFETSNDDCIKIVEWPELIDQKPENRIDIFFSYSKFMESRTVEVSGFGKWKDYNFDEI